jgi:hypothetical protein
VRIGNVVCQRFQTLPVSIRSFLRSALTSISRERMSRSVVIKAGKEGEVAVQVESFFRWWRWCVIEFGESSLGGGWFTEVKCSPIVLVS